MPEEIVPDSLADRYGRSGSTASPRRRRWIYWSLLTVFVLAGLGVGLAYYENFGAAPITTKNLAFQVVDDHTVRITFRVRRDDPSRPADCIVRSRDGRGTETGRREVFVPPSDGPVEMSTVLHTTRRPSTGETYGCSYQVPRYLSRSTPPTG
jgi:hypothetical protein